MTIILSVITGLLAGGLSGLFGIGGATIIIPVLIYFFGFSQHQAQGTALAAMLPPVGLLAAIRYYYGGNIVLDVAVYAAIGFFIGGFVGAMIAHPIPDIILRRMFAVYLMVIAVKMIF